MKPYFCLFAVLFLSNSSIAQQAVPSEREGIELKAFVKNYANAFNQENAEKVQSFFHFPHSTLNQDQEFKVITQKSELNLEPFWEVIKTDYGWKSNKVTDIKIYAATEEKAMVSLEMEGVDNEGKTFTLVRGFLGMSKVGGKWGFSQVAWYFFPAE
ncbi:hypothetical protein OAH34_01840 [bacterium]|nr:hypothetical protein [bacterium]